MGTTVHLYHQLYTERRYREAKWTWTGKNPVPSNVCSDVLFHTIWEEKSFLLLGSYAKVMCWTWRVDDLTVNPYTRTGRNDRIHMESCLLHVNARPSIWKPLLNLCNWHWTCHVINTPPWWRKKTFKWKVSARGGVRVKQLHTICSLHSLHFCIAHHDPVRECEERGTWLGLLSHPWAEPCRNIQCKPWADGSV